MPFDSPWRVQRVLIVDDERNLLRALAAGIATVGVPSVHRREWSSGHQIDPLITDLSMPDEDGIEQSRTSWETVRRLGCPVRTFQVQNSRKPFRCQAITVWGLTITRADRQ
jgi:DNA-binding NtrC family response regulator